MATRKKGSSGSNGRRSDTSWKREQERLTRRMAEGADHLVENAERMAEHAERLALESDQRVRSTVRSRPMTSVWTSFGLGVGLGLALVSLLPRDESRDRGGWDWGDWSMDDVSSSLRSLSDRVEALGRSTLHRASDTTQDLGRSASRRAQDMAERLHF